MKKKEALEEAARWIEEADAIVLLSGAGMGVDSGLGTFRGSKAGSWQDSEGNDMFLKHSTSYMDLSDPDAFQNKPLLAWAWWSRSYRLYNDMQQHAPHKGYKVLRRWAKKKPMYCMTSNIDGHFRKAGFPPESVSELHGSVDFLQCTDLDRHCTRIWPAKEEVERIEVEPRSGLVSMDCPLPKCQECGALARPNVCMFGDIYWNPARMAKTWDEYQAFLEEARGKRLLVIEIGAGTFVKTVRNHNRKLLEGDFPERKFIRINVEDCEIDEEMEGTGIALPTGAKKALNKLDKLLKGDKKKKKKKGGKKKKGKKKR